MDENRGNPFRRGPRGAGSPGSGPDRGKRGPGKGLTQAGAEPPRRGGIRKLPADLRDLAEGRVDRLRRPPRAREVLEEPEGTRVVPGVRNTEARAVYDRRVARLRAAVGRDDTPALEQGLYEVQLLALWRARNVTDFDAFGEHVVGLGVERARELAKAGAVRFSAGSGAAPETETLSRELVALWVRAEASLIQISPTASVRVVRGDGGPELELRLAASPVPAAVEALRSLGPALVGLAKLTSTEVPERALPPRR